MVLSIVDLKKKTVCSNSATAIYCLLAAISQYFVLNSVSWNDNYLFKFCYSAAI